MLPQCILPASEVKQRTITHLISEAGQKMLQHGAESELVFILCKRLGRALGVDSVEIALSASAIVVSTFTDEHYITTVRACPAASINMRMLTQIQYLVVQVERGYLSIDTAKARLEALVPYSANRWFVAVMVGVACACFSRLYGGDVGVFCTTFVASTVGVIVRQSLELRLFKPLVTFSVTACVTTLISSCGVLLHIGDNPDLAMASSVLMLVPGVPLINSASDMVKGFVNMGVARFVSASLLSLAICVGIVAAMTMTNVWGWS